MSFWSPNLETSGRIIRAICGSFLITAGTLGIFLGGPLWACLACWALGLFCLAEAAGAWCLARACGLKTKW